MWPPESKVMKRPTSWLQLLGAILGSVLTAVATSPQSIAQETTDEILLIVRSDDMGATHAINHACLESVTDGIARSIEVLVPSPWFVEAAELLKAHPDIDVGVHLDLVELKIGLGTKNHACLLYTSDAADE